MPIQKHLDVTLLCPLSGFEVGGQVIPPHRMATMQCENGSLFARCPNHVTRVFISDFTTVRQVMNKAVIVQITDRNPRKKEKSNGET